MDARYRVYQSCASRALIKAAEGYMDALQKEQECLWDEIYRQMGIHGMEDIKKVQ